MQRPQTPLATRSLLNSATNTHQQLDPTAPAPGYLHGRRDACLQAFAQAVATPAGELWPDHLVTERIETQLHAMLDQGVVDTQLLEVAALLIAEHPAPPSRRLTWVGPLAFQRATAAQRGIDMDLGFDWGDGRDTRISCRREPDATRGLLYAYNRTWDEYAVLSDSISVQHVETVYKATVLGDGHPSLDAFILNLYLLRPTITPPLQAQPAPDPNLAPTLGMVSP